MAGEPLIEISYDHPWAPPRAQPDEPIPVLPKRPPLPQQGIPNVTEGSSNSHEAHYCYIPGMDLLILQVFNFGFDEDDFWAFRVSHTPLPFTEPKSLGCVFASAQDPGSNLLPCARIYGRNPFGFWAKSTARLGLCR